MLSRNTVEGKGLRIGRNTFGLSLMIRRLLSQRLFWYHTTNIQQIWSLAAPNNFIAMSSLVVQIARSCAGFFSVIKWVAEHIMMRWLTKTGNVLTGLMISKFLLLDLIWVLQKNMIIYCNFWWKKLKNIYKIYPAGKLIL